jgi:hypothetical protein
MKGNTQPVAREDCDISKSHESVRTELGARPATHRAGGVIYRRARLDDDADLRMILRDGAMVSWVTVSLEREPSYFSGENLMGESFTVIAHEESVHPVPVGMYSCAFLPVHVNGRPERIGYLGGLRVCRPYRHKLRVIKNGFASIQVLMPDRGTVPYWFTSVASEHAAARRLLEARLPGMPVYQPVGELETLVLDAQQHRTQGLLQQATQQDVPVLVDFFNRQACAYQFAPLLNEIQLLKLTGETGLTLGDFWLLKDGRDIRGCLAVWDQRAFKQSVIRGYRFPLSALRGAYNTWARIANRLRLPAPGERLEHAFLAFVAFDGAAENVYVDAVREGLAKVRDKGAHAGVLGLSPQNTLARVLKSGLRTHAYRTCIQTVAWPDDAQPQLDGRPPQPEVALL